MQSMCREQAALVVQLVAQVEAQTGSKAAAVQHRAFATVPQQLHQLLLAMGESQRLSSQVENVKHGACACLLQASCIHCTLVLSLVDHQILALQYAH